MADGDTEATIGLMATTATMERGLLRPSLLLRLLLPLRPRLTPGMDTTAMATGPMATTGLMAMDTTMERGLLRLSPRPLLMLLLRLLLMLSLLLRLLLPLRLRLIPGTDTTAMATGLMA